MLSSGLLWTLQSITESGFYAQSTSIQMLFFKEHLNWANKAKVFVFFSYWGQTCLYTVASSLPCQTQRTRKTSWDQRFFSFCPPKGSSKRTTIHHACNVNCWWKTHFRECLAWKGDVVYQTSTQRRWQEPWRHI